MYIRKEGVMYTGVQVDQAICEARDATVRLCFKATRPPLGRQLDDKRHHFAAGNWRPNAED